MSIQLPLAVRQAAILGFVSSGRLTQRRPQSRSASISRRALGQRVHRRTMTPLNSEASATNFETRNAANAAIDELPASAGHADPAAIQASRAGSRVDKRQSVPETKAQLGGMATQSRATPAFGTVEAISPRWIPWIF